MVIEIFKPEEQSNSAGTLLAEMLEGVNPGVSYADMMRLRVSGGAVTMCEDTYYVAIEEDRCVSRLWNGWGKHERAIGNFGNFLTLEEARGKGLGHRMLEVWYDDLCRRKQKPLGLFCSAKERAAKLYFPYGFRPALKGRDYGPLYMPLGDSPESFQELCDWYYEPAQRLIRRKATLEWRHEIDCLLKFAMLDRGLTFGIGETTGLEPALLYKPERAELLFTPSDRCVGWMMDEIAQVHPQYSGIQVTKE